MNAVDFSRQKLDSLLETIELIEERAEPYKDPSDAVQFLRNQLQQDRELLADSETDHQTLLTHCKRVQELIDESLTALGFVVRACDPNGAVELHGPLRSLTRKAIPEVGLIISSEWDFSPFTMLYPNDFGNKFVLVGLPVSEVTNPLIAPLAGHELGHNIWRTLLQLQDDVGSAVDEKVLYLIENKFWDDFSQRFNIKDKKQLGQKELFGVPINWEQASVWAVAQCEEMFCDFIGLSIFRESYLNAFEYTLLPGGGIRTPRYPAISTRIQNLKLACGALGLKISPDFGDDFTDSDVSSDTREKLFQQIADEAAEMQRTMLMEEAIKYCKDHGLAPDSQKALDKLEAEIQATIEDFRKVVPARAERSLCSIINAAWSIYADTTNYWEKNYPSTNEPGRRFELIRELALKSFEVIEIEQYRN